MTEDKKPKQREFLGMPMNWDSKNMFQNFWNRKDDELFPPKRFGIGWDVNFHALLRSLGLIKKNKSSQDQR